MKGTDTWQPPLANLDAIIYSFFFFMGLLIQRILIPTEGEGGENSNHLHHHLTKLQTCVFVELENGRMIQTEFRE
ncbi:hypothetical protein MKW98_029937 [Papaver atlanticum]|uniref:Uncharacterized protein n=1 Tax=Papaver atlanticum TaxID=357466 RepID=A0AAD4TN89_9MAGN|nr:hypothetical protein MKW98_029937 [Papaver atlanticum]